MGEWVETGCEDLPPSHEVGTRLSNPRHHHPVAWARIALRPSAMTSGGRLGASGGALWPLSVPFGSTFRLSGGRTGEPVSRIRLDAHLASASVSNIFFRDGEFASVTLSLRHGLTHRRTLSPLPLRPDGAGAGRNAGRSRSLTSSPRPRTPSGRLCANENCRCDVAP